MSLRDPIPTIPVAVDHHRAIIDLTIAYTWILDEQRFDDLGQVFTADAIGDLHGIHCEGLAAIVERIRTPLVRLDVTQHVASNHQVRVDGETATSRCYLVGQHVKRGTPWG